MRKWNGFYKIIKPTENTLYAMMTWDGEFTMVRGPEIEFYSGGTVVSAADPPTPYYQDKSRFADAQRLIMPCGEKHFGTCDLWNMDVSLSSDTSGGSEEGGEMEEEKGDEEKSIVLVERAHRELVDIAGKYSEGKYTVISVSEMIAKVAEFYEQGYFILCTQKWTHSFQAQEVFPIESPLFIVVDYAIPGVISVPGLEIPPMTTEDILQLMLKDYREFQAYIAREKAGNMAPAYYAALYDKIDFKRNVVVTFPTHTKFLCEALGGGILKWFNKE